MAAYHTRFRHFAEGTLSATDRLFRTRPSTLDEGRAVTAMGEWLDSVSALYGVPCPALRLAPPSQCCGSGCYQPGGVGSILLPFPSVTTELHEFRHHLQHHGVPMVRSRFDSPGLRAEEDARSWSLSLYFKVRPGLFARLVRDGRIFYVTPPDLTAA
jgi:hypothetical protein